MKKYIIFIIIIVLIITAGVVLLNYLALPEYIRDPNQNEAEENGAAQMKDARITSALEAGENSVMDGAGMDMDFSADLLNTVKRYFATDLEYWGAGVFHGSFDEAIALEVLLNSKGNVGRIQLCITEQAAEATVKEAVMKYAGFVNRTLDTEELSAAAEEVLPRLTALQPNETYLYYGYDTGFQAEVQDGYLLIYTP